jgi:GNAT superfamily N-acetyltransferase
MDITSKLKCRTWSKDQFFISTDPSLIPINTLNAWFASDHVYWAKAMPDEAVRETLQNSLCFGLYKSDAPISHGDISSQSSLEFIGIARCVTDFTTFVYLTDVFIDPSYQDNGLGKWLVGCVHEAIQSMPYLRRSLLFTGDWKRSVPFYERELGMSVIECKKGEGLAVMQRMWEGFPGFESP